LHLAAEHQGHVRLADMVPQTGDDERSGAEKEAGDDPAKHR
jgi:hypothetical protein